jgi:hypothetical protein
MPISPEDAAILAEILQRVVPGLKLGGATEQEEEPKQAPYVESAASAFGGQPGAAAAQFAPQSYKGVPTFTGGVPYPPNEYEKIRAYMGILTNLMGALKEGGGGGSWMDLIPRPGGIEKVTPGGK